MLSNLGEQSYKELSAIAVSSQKDMDLRWRAIVSLGMLYPKTSQKNLVEWLQSKKWFIRNAAIIGLSHGDIDALKPQLIKIMDDPALVVRTSAVQIIHKL